LESTQVYSSVYTDDSVRATVANPLLSKLAGIKPDIKKEADKIRKNNIFSLITATALKNANKQREAGKPAAEWKSVKPSDDFKADKNNSNVVSIGSQRPVVGDWTAKFTTGTINRAANEAAQAAKDSALASNSTIPTLPKDPRKPHDAAQKIRPFVGIYSPEGGWVKSIAPEKDLEQDKNKEYKLERSKEAEITKDGFVEKLEKTAEGRAPLSKEQELVLQVRISKILENLRHDMIDRKPGHNKPVGKFTEKEMSRRSNALHRATQKWS
jgi:hypothetical protein